MRHVTTRRSIPPAWAGEYADQPVISGTAVPQADLTGRRRATWIVDGEIGADPLTYQSGPVSESEHPAPLTALCQHGKIIVRGLLSDPRTVMTAPARSSDSAAHGADRPLSESDHHRCSDSRTGCPVQLAAVSAPPLLTKTSRP